MKKIILGIFILIGFIGNAQSISVLDDKNGFREFHFGDSISLYPNLKSFGQTEDSLFVFYRKMNDSLQIGNIPPKGKIDIVYTFYKDQLATVFIQTNDSTDSRNALKYLENLCGKGRKDDPYIERYYWNGREIMLTYHEDVNSFEAKIFIRSIRMKLKSEGRDKY